MADKADEKWLQHLNKIAELYVEDDLSFDAIAEYLASECDLRVSGHTVKKKLYSWGIKRFSREEELKLLAQHLQRCRQAGKSATFLRFGRPYSSDLVRAYLLRNPLTTASDDPLPKHLAFVEVESTSDFDDSIEEINPFAAGADALSGRKRDSDGFERKKRRTEMPTRTRPQPARSPVPKERPPPERSSNSDDVTEVTKTDSREGPKQSNNSAVEDMENAITKLKALSRDLGLKEDDITEALLKPEKLEELVERSKERAREEEESTDLGPLHYAANANNVPIIKSLLAKKADVNARGGNGWTAAHIAAGRGHFEALATLLEHPAIELNAVDDKGVTPLVRAIFNESSGCALLLVRAGADVDKEIPNGQTPLHRACVEKNMGTLVAEILAKTKKINHQDDNQRTPLHLAVNENNEDYVRMLINANADLNVPDKDGRTPMHQACFDRSADLLMEMVEHEDVDLAIAGNHKETVLHLLCQRELCSVAEAVLSKPGVDINARTQINTTPLILAASNGSYQTVKMLVEHGADPSIHDQDMDTALTLAIRRGDTKMAELLIENGSPVNPQNKTTARYKAELENKRAIQEVATVLNGLTQRSQGAAAARSLAAQRTRQQPLKSPSIHAQAVQQLDKSDAEALLRQMFNEYVGRVEAGPSSMVSTGSNNFGSGVMGGFDATAGFNDSMQMNFMASDMPTAFMFGSGVDYSMEL